MTELTKKKPKGEIQRVLMSPQAALSIVEAAIQTATANGNGPEVLEFLAKAQAREQARVAELARQRAAARQ